MKVRHAACGLLVMSLLWVNVPVGVAQGDDIDPEFSKYLVHYVGKRSMPERLLNVAGLTSQDVGRSFALIAGVSRYPRMESEYRYLAPVSRDVDLLLEYLKNQQFFDEIVVLRDEAVSFDSMRYFLETYFPERLKKFPKARFVFAYSGHGMTEGDAGYLLTSSAKNLKDKQHSIDMIALRDFSRQTVDAAYQSLLLINACHSGAFVGRSREGPWDVLLKRRGAHVIMSSGVTDSSFGSAEHGSVFYEKLIDGLNGGADPTGKGVITVADLGAYLQTEVGLATGGKQVPTAPQDIWSGVSDGGMFFFNRQKAVKIANLPAWNPKSVLPLGGDQPTEDAGTVVPQKSSSGPRLESVGCQGGTNIRSLDGAIPATLRFVNLLPSPVTIYWIDYDGNEQHWADLPGNNSLDLQTFASHPWAVRDVTGRCVAVFIAKAPSAIAEISQTSH